MMKGKNQQLGYKSLTECVKDYLKERLVNGELKPGEEINFAVLCETLGVSRTPVREALIQLVRDGCVEEATRKGFHVKQLSLSEIRELYEIGGLLDGEIVQSACDRITDADIDALEAILRRAESAMAENDGKAYLERNGEFNAFLRSFCANKTLNEFSEKVRERLYFTKKRPDFREWDKIIPDWNKVLLVDHYEIVRLLRARDKAGLDNLMRNRHWDFSRNLPFVRLFYKLADDDAVR